MTRPMIAIHDCETDEVIQREMNDEEYAQWESDQAAKQAEADEIAKTAAEKAALLTKLGITEDEAKLLLG